MMLALYIKTVKPASRPLVTGFRPSYRVGDVLNVTCVVADTFPAANITWFISGERVSGGWGVGVLTGPPLKRCF